MIERRFCWIGKNGVLYTKKGAITWTVSVIAPSIRY